MSARQTDSVCSLKMEYLVLSFPIYTITIAISWATGNHGKRERERERERKNGKGRQVETLSVATTAVS